MAEQELKLLEHLSPINLPIAGQQVGFLEMNNPGFNIKKQFLNDCIAYDPDGWWIVNKTLSWSLLDCMILDTAKDIRSSFSDFPHKEIEKMFNIAYELVSIAKKKPNVKLVVAGANINRATDGDNLLRLHFHITALSENDFSRMKQIPTSALDKESLKKIYDPQMATFQKSLIPFIQKVLKVEKINFLAITGSREVIKIEFHDKFELIKQPVFTNLITNVDSFIRKNFHGLSYSLLILDKDGHLEMRLSPRSVDGKGVLEMAGIILKRDPDISFSTEDNSEKIAYFKEINKQVCRKFSGFESGNYIDLFEKENIKVLPCKK